MLISPHFFLQIIDGAGHHVYADGYEEFNDIVMGACRISDKREEKKHNKEKEVS